MFRNIFLYVFGTLLLVNASCSKMPIDSAFAGKEVSYPSDSVTFAVIGDYGEDSENEAKVAAMVKLFLPEFIITTGDNNYPLGSAGTIKNNIGKHYCEFIYNPDAPEDRICTGRAADEKKNRFFPCPGNHDNYSVPAIGPYLDYFTLPGDERNYDFVWGPVHFFSLNTGMSGRLSNKTIEWLKVGLLQSQSPFKIVYLHHPPFSPGNHGSSKALQLPYGAWGADAVLAGHEHFYARIMDKELQKPVYLIVGNSGNENLYNCNAHPLNPARFDVSMCDNKQFGAIKVVATRTSLIFQYFKVGDLAMPVDSYEITK